VLYLEFLQTSWWQEIRRHVLEINDYRCRRCEGIASQVHHTSYTGPARSDTPDWILDSCRPGWSAEDCNLEPLCSKCHREEHTAMSMKDPKWEKIERRLDQLVRYGK
jgi:hypothetical protein